MSPRGRSSRGAGRQKRSAALETETAPQTESRKRSKGIAAVSTTTSETTEENILDDDSDVSMDQENDRYSKMEANMEKIFASIATLQKDIKQMKDEAKRNIPSQVRRESMGTASSLTQPPLTAGQRKNLTNNTKADLRAKLRRDFFKQWKFIPENNIRQWVIPKYKKDGVIPEGFFTDEEVLRMILQTLGRLRTNSQNNAKRRYIRKFFSSLFVRKAGGLSYKSFYSCLYLQTTITQTPKIMLPW